MTNELKLSVSKCKTFSQCKKQFEFSYILKLPKKERDYHTFGKFCHKVLEDYHKEYIDGCTDPANTVMSNAFRNALKEFPLSKEMKKECWEIIDKYLKLIIINKIKNNVIACEKKFDLILSDNVILTGMIDRIQIDDDNVIHVADYKTTKNKKYLKDDFFQLLTYAYVILSENPDIEKIRASYILLRHDFEYITTEFSITEILEIKDKYIAYAESISSEKEYAPNPTALCSYCDFLEHCTEGKTKSFGQNIYGEINW